MWSCKHPQRQGKEKMCLASKASTHEGRQLPKRSPQGKCWRCMSSWRRPQRCRCLRGNSGRCYWKYCLQLGYSCPAVRKIEERCVCRGGGG